MPYNDYAWKRHRILKSAFFELFSCEEGESMNPLKVFSLFTVLFLASTTHAQKHPEIFDVSDVVIGAQRLPTRYLYAAGAWSDASEIENALSVQIECYKRIDLCNVARAVVAGQGPGSVGVVLDAFDILRWDEREMLAVDSSAICVINTIRADFVAKTITINSAKKATKLADEDPFCTDVDQSTAFLVNHEEVKKRSFKRRRRKSPSPIYTH